MVHPLCIHYPEPIPEAHFYIGVENPNSNLCNGEYCTGLLQWANYGGDITFDFGQIRDSVASLTVNGDSDSSVVHSAYANIEDDYPNCHKLQVLCQLPCMP